MTWHPAHDEVRSSGWSKIPAHVDGDEAEDDDS